MAKALPDKVINITNIIKKKYSIKKSGNSGKEVYQLKITLDGFKPEIYRTVIVPDNITLNQLHLVIQSAFGWLNYHLHDFTKKNKRYTDYFDDGSDGNEEDDREIKLSELDLKVKDKFIYQYDFGDSWYHSIKLEKILPYETSVKYPFCLKGAMKCPPEDVGGIWGYAEFLEKVSDPDNEEHEDMLGWLGIDYWDPEEFDIKKVNKILAKLKLKY